MPTGHDPFPQMYSAQHGTNSEILRAGNCYRGLSRNRLRKKSVERHIGQRKALGSFMLALLVTASAFGTTMVLTAPPHSAKPSNVVQLTSGPAESIEPAFSPDGRYLAFSYNRAGSYDIWLVREDG